MDDRELLDRLKTGDQTAFDAIFRAHYASLVSLAQGMLRDQSAAEDVAQEVMLELWRRRADVVIQESLRAYLIRSTHNRALSRSSRERKRSNRTALLRSLRASCAPPSPPRSPSCRRRVAKCSS